MTTPTEQPEAQAMSHVVKEHDPHHPYVRRFIGCGHGVLFTDYCKDCEIVAVQEQYKNAIRTVQRCRNELRRLGVSLPGQTSLPVHQPVHERDVCPTCEALARTASAIETLDAAIKALEQRVGES